eukprot:749119-Hanusia_phi.AAC.1
MAEEGQEDLDAADLAVDSRDVSDERDTDGDRSASTKQIQGEEADKEGVEEEQEGRANMDQEEQRGSIEVKQEEGQKKVRESLLPEETEV